MARLRAESEASAMPIHVNNRVSGDLTIDVPGA
jgi:hypothetical protein